MAWNSDDLTKIETAIAAGAQEVEYSTGRVVYKSLNDMLRVRDLIRRALGVSVSIKKINPKTSKGL